MRRETKYTLAGFAVFIYSPGLIALFMISFSSAGTPGLKLSAAALSLLAGASGALMVHLHPKGIHFKVRAVGLLAAVTVANLLIWILICEGTFNSP
jgi:hypothetical protein